MFKLNDLVHSALYKFGRVVKIEKRVPNDLGYSNWIPVNSIEGLADKDGVVTVQWNKAGYGKSHYYLNGQVMYSENTYASLQLVDPALTLPEKYLAGEVMAEEEITSEIQTVEKWQTIQMDIHFKIPKKK